MKTILRIRPYYSAKTLVDQYETHVWGIMETHNGAIFHASTSALAKIDRLQKHFLDELQLTEEEAFLQFNFAPPILRRNIGILGLLHKRVLGKAHPIFESLLPFHFDVFGNFRPGEHRKQLYNHICDMYFQPELFKRSIFNMVYSYNRLPNDAIECMSVKLFQSCLTKMARDQCEHENPRWKFMFDRRLH